MKSRKTRRWLGSVLEPILFAAPVSKWYAGRIDEINNEKTHLLIYNIKTPWVGRAKIVADQFSAYSLYLREGVRLAVPSLKTKVREIGGRQ